MSRSKRHPSQWVLIERDDARYDLERAGRPLASDMTWQAALRYLRRHMRPADRLLTRAPDGYTTPGPPLS